MRKRSLDMVHTLAKRDERVVFIGSDLSPNLLGEMKKEFPSRYYMEGIAEANIIGMAAGMAMDGFVPYVNTIATFITRRCYEQVAVDLCLHDLPVRLIGNGGGYVYAPLGPTHEAIEDIAIMRALPRMTVTAVCDADEMTRLMDATLDWPHPIYIRLGKGGDPVISKPERGFAIGKAIDMIDGETGASDVLLIGTGVATTQALKAAGSLAADGIRCRLLHVHTVKPLDADAIVDAASKTKLVLTVEEHSVDRRSGQRRPRDAVGPADGRSAAGEAIGHPRQVRRALRQPGEADGGLPVRRQGHRRYGPQVPGGARAGEQRPQFLAGRGAQARGCRSCATATSSFPPRSRADLDRISRSAWPISPRLSSSCRRPEDKGAFLDRIHDKVDVQRLNDLRLAVIREMNEESWTRLVLLQHRAPCARGPGRQRAGHAASHQSQHPAAQRRQLAAAGPCRRLGWRSAVRSRACGFPTSTSTAPRRCSSCRATRMPAIRRRWASSS